MLSFDITDKELKIVRGLQTGTKVKILSTLIIEINDGLIVNGYIQDIQKLANIIAEKFREKRLVEKEVVASISSSAVVFRELSVPKMKGTQLTNMVKNQLQQNMQISDEFSISYTIVGEDETNGSGMYKILSSACPREIVDNYRSLFNLLNMQLKSFSVSCNCISRVVLADNKNKDKMPLLVVQIDKNFLNINLFEQNQLAFSRFITISKEDYDSDDYLVDALNDNVFKMIQFNRSRGGSGIKDIIFYGDVQDYIKLTMAIEQQEVRTHILAVPSSVVGYEKIEFTTFANAVGAMFKAKKETESINLLGVEPSFSFSKSNSNYAKTIAVVAVACMAITGAAFFSLKLKNDAVTKDCTTTQDYIDSNKTKLEKIQKENSMLDKLKKYNAGAVNAQGALKSMPLITSESFDKIRQCAGTNATITNIDYKTGLLKVTLETTNKDFPATLVKDLIKLDYFGDVSYSGFEKKDEKSNIFKFELVINQKAGETK